MSDLQNGLRVLGSQIESTGQALVARVGPLNVWTGVLLCGAVLLDRVLARRARASLRVALYVPVALRVFLPLDWSLPIAAGPHLVTVLTPPTLLGPAVAPAPATWQTPSWHAVAALVYVAVATFIAARAGFARLRLARALATALPVAVPGLRLPCPVVQHEELGPMVVGLLSPRIVLPRHLLAPGQDRTLACVLRHEAAHLRRGDAWLSAAMQLLAAIAWPIIPLWIAMVRVRQLVELACDEAALTGADASERHLYGHTLLDMAEWRSAVTLGAGELHFGSTLRARIEALASRRRWPIAAQTLVLSLAPLAMLGACSGSTPPAVTPAATGADTDYGYLFEPDSEKIAAANVGANPAATNADGRISPEKVQAAVRAHFGAFHACYASGLARNPSLTGLVSIKAVIGKDGATKSAADGAMNDENAHSSPSTLPDKDVIACIAGEFGKIAYPPGPGVLTIVYPMQLAP